MNGMALATGSTKLRIPWKNRRLAPCRSLNVRWMPIFPKNAAISGHPCQKLDGARVISCIGENDIRDTTTGNQR